MLATLLDNIVSFNLPSEGGYLRDKESAERGSEFLRMFGGFPNDSCVYNVPHGDIGKWKKDWSVSLLGAKDGITVMECRYKRSLKVRDP